MCWIPRPMNGNEFFFFAYASRRRQGLRAVNKWEREANVAFCVSLFYSVPCITLMRLVGSCVVPFLFFVSLHHLTLALWGTRSAACLVHKMRLFLTKKEASSRLWWHVMSDKSKVQVACNVTFTRLFEITMLLRMLEETWAGHVCPKCRHVAVPRSMDTLHPSQNCLRKHLIQRRSSTRFAQGCWRVWVTRCASMSAALSAVVTFCLLSRVSSPSILATTHVWCATVSCYQDQMVLMCGVAPLALTTCPIDILIPVHSVIIRQDTDIWSVRVRVCLCQCCRFSHGKRNE